MVVLVLLSELRRIVVVALVVIPDCVQAILGVNKGFFSMTLVVRVLSMILVMKDWSSVVLISVIIFDMTTKAILTTKAIRLVLLCGPVIKHAMDSSHLCNSYDR